MSVSSLILNTRPQQVTQVSEAAAAFPGVEVHAVTADGRIIVTVEDVSGCAVADTLVRLHNLEGVVAASLVYHYSDDDSELQEITS